MSENAIPSVGTKLQRGDGASPEVFTDVAERTTITPFNGSTEVLDGSDLGSAWRVKLPGMLDGGQLQFTVHLIPGSTGHQDLLEDWTTRTVRNFRVVFPDADATTWEFALLITGVSPTVQMGQTIQCSFTAEISGEPDFEAA